MLGFAVAGVDFDVLVNFTTRGEELNALDGVLARAVLLNGDTVYLEGVLTSGQILYGLLQFGIADGTVAEVRIEPAGIAGPGLNELVDSCRYTGFLIGMGVVGTLVTDVGGIGTALEGAYPAVDVAFESGVHEQRGEVGRIAGACTFAQEGYLGLHVFTEQCCVCSIQCFLIPIVVCLGVFPVVNVKPFLGDGFRYGIHILLHTKHLQFRSKCTICIRSNEEPVYAHALVIGIDIRGNNRASAFPTEEHDVVIGLDFTPPVRVAFSTADAVVTVLLQFDAPVDTPSTLIVVVDVVSGNAFTAENLQSLRLGAEELITDNLFRIVEIGDEVGQIGVLVCALDGALSSPCITTTQIAATCHIVQVEGILHICGAQMISQNCALGQWCYGSGPRLCLHADGHEGHGNQ